MKTVIVLAAFVLAFTLSATFADANCRRNEELLDCFQRMDEDLRRRHPIIDPDYHRQRQNQPSAVDRLNDQPIIVCERDRYNQVVCFSY